MVNHAGKIIHDQIFLLLQVVPKATTVAMLALSLTIGLAETVTA